MAPNYMAAPGNYMPQMGLMSQPYPPKNLADHVYFDQRNGNFGYLAKTDANTMGQLGDAHLNEYFYQELVPHHKKPINPESIFERYKQTNNLEDIAEENSLQESGSLCLSKAPKDSLSFSSPENLKKIHFDEKSAEFVKSKEPWELESRAFAKDVFFDAVESQVSKETRKALNISGSLNLVSPVTSMTFLTADRATPHSNVPRPNPGPPLKVDTTLEHLKLKKVPEDVPRSPKKKRLLYKKKIKATQKPQIDPIVQERRKDVSIERKVSVFDEMQSKIPQKGKQSSKKKQRPRRSREKIRVSRSKSPVTSAYKKILLTKTSTNLDIKEVVEKSLQKNQTRRLSLSPESRGKWTLSRQEFKNLRKKFSLHVLKPRTAGLGKNDVKQKFRIKSMVLKSEARERSEQK